MKKPFVFALGAVAAVVLAYAGATWWTGTQTQAVYEENVAQLQRSYPGLRVIDHQYQRGFRHSTSTLTLQYDPPGAGSNADPGSADAQADTQADQEGEEPEAAPQPAPEDDESSEGSEGSEGSESSENSADADAGTGADEDAAPQQSLILVLNDRITHGPLTGLATLESARIESTLTLDPRSSPETAATQQGQVLATAQTRVAFSGDFKSTVQGPALTWTTPAGEAIRWQGFQGALASTGGAQQWNYEFTAAGLLMDNNDQGMHLSVSGLSLRGIDKSMNALWTLSGRDEGQIGGIDIRADTTADDGKPFVLALKNIQFQQSSKTSGDLLDTTLQATGTGMAGDLPIDGFELRTSLTRLHAPTYLRMTEQIAGLAPEDAEGAEGVMRDNLAALLAYNPEYALDKLSLTIAGLQGEASYRLSMPGVTPEEKDVPLSLLASSRLSLDAQASLPVSWAEWIARESALDGGGDLTPTGAKVLLEELVRQRLVVRDGPDRIKTRVTYDKGRLQVNGKTLRGGLGALSNL